MDLSALRRYMTGQRFGVVSTIAHGGESQSALVGLTVAPDLSVFFDTVKTSRKYSNLIRYPQCSLVIGWDHEQTVQFEGDAAQPHGDELQTYQQMYFAAWPDGPMRLGWPDIAYFVVRPRWIRYSDYSATPPRITEFSFSSEA